MLSFCLLCHPRDIEHVFVDSQRGFAKETGQKPTRAKTGSYHYALMHTDGKDWLYKRRHLQPLFKRERVDTGVELREGCPGRVSDDLHETRCRNESFE